MTYKGINKEYLGEVVKRAGKEFIFDTLLYKVVHAYEIWQHVNGYLYVSMGLFRVSQYYEERYRERERERENERREKLENDKPQEKRCTKIGSNFLNRYVKYTLGIAWLTYLHKFENEIFQTNEIWCYIMIETNFSAENSFSFT